MSKATHHDAFKWDISLISLHAVTSLCCYISHASLHLCSVDYSRLNNINALVLGLWPSVSEAVKQQIVMQMVPSMMDQAVKDYGAGYLTGLKLLEFDLGKVCVFGVSNKLESCSCDCWLFDMLLLPISIDSPAHTVTLWVRTLAVSQR